MVRCIKSEIPAKSRHLSLRKITPLKGVKCSDSVIDILLFCQQGGHCPGNQGKVKENEKG